MKVAIITGIAQESSDSLAETLNYNEIQTKVFLTKDGIPYDLRSYDYVFSYGCSEQTLHKKRINSALAVKMCINKMTSFSCFEKANVPTVAHTVDRKVAEKSNWEWVVVRDSLAGRKAEGYQVVQNFGKLPEGKLFTEFFDHKREYRIVVFMGEVVGRYYKCLDENGWHQFNLQPKRGFEAMDAACIRAARQLGIDYVGFDVVSNNKKDFRVLEANSGPIITDESLHHIATWFVNQKG